MKDYAATLAEVRTLCPALAAELERAHENRVERLTRFCGGAVLRGVNEMLVHLNEVAAALRADPRGLPLAYLIERARCQYAVAIEAMLGGMHYVVYDSMRVVMEIEFLLRDFSLFPAHVKEWATDAKARRKRFKPIHLRERAAAVVGKKPADMTEDADYRGHSEWLHVNPPGILHSVGGEPGIASEALPVVACLSEMFEHGRRLLFAMDKAAPVIVPGLTLRSPDDLAAFRDGWERARGVEQRLWAGVGAKLKATEL